MSNISWDLYDRTVFRLLSDLIDWRQRCTSRGSNKWLLQTCSMSGFVLDVFMVSLLKNVLPVRDIHSTALGKDAQVWLLTFWDKNFDRSQGEKRHRMEALQASAWIQGCSWQLQVTGKWMIKTGLRRAKQCIIKETDRPTSLHRLMCRRRHAGSNYSNQQFEQLQIFGQYFEILVGRLLGLKTWFRTSQFCLRINKNL